MARALDVTQITAADELRGLLAESEKQVANLRGQSQAALDLLRNLDRIDLLWPQLEAAGVDLRPEAGRWETLQAQVGAHAGALLSALKPVGGIAALRGKVAAPGQPSLQEPRTRDPQSPIAGEQSVRDDPEARAEGLAWWWYLDQRQRDQRRKRATRWLGIGLAVFVVAAAAILIFRRLFPVDPKVAAAVTRLNAGQQDATDKHDYAAALAEFQAAAGLTPGEAEPWLWLGVTQQKLGQDPAQSFTNGRRASTDELTYLLARGPIYAQVESFDEARADLNAALKLDAQNPLAWYYLAGVDEAQGKLPAAAADLDKASTYADARQNSQLVAMARVRLGYLLQRMQAGSLDETPPTPAGP